MHVFEQYQQLERYIGWTDEDAHRVKSLGPLLSPYFDTLIDDFYAEIQRHPEAARVITGGQQQIDRLKRTLLGWLDELFSGPYDEDYVARRWGVSKRHVDIGLDQLYTNASLLRLRRGLLGALAEAWQGDLSEQLRCRESLNLLLDLNLAIIEHAYQAEYERRQTTAERLATIGKVAGSIVEELRGPLDAAKDSIAFLRDRPDAPPEEQRVHLDRLDRQAYLAEGVVSALNDFVRLPLESFQPVDIIECLHGAFDLDAVPQAVRVQRDLPVAKLWVLGDPAQLRIVLSNLLRYAYDAMAGSGLLRLGAMPDGDAVYITIQHIKRCKCSGACKRSGVSEPHAEPQPADVLQPADMPQPAQPTVCGKKPGIGLGLSILHDIVLRHRGALTITTGESAGTTATLRLPTHQLRL